MLVVSGPVHLCLLDSHRSVKALTGWAPACLSAGPSRSHLLREEDQGPPLPFQLETHHPPGLSVPGGGGGGCLRMRGSRLFIPTRFLFIKSPLWGPCCQQESCVSHACAGSRLPAASAAYVGLLGCRGCRSCPSLTRAVSQRSHQSWGPSRWRGLWQRVTGLGITRPGGDLGSEPEFLSSAKLDQVIAQYLSQHLAHCSDK